MFTVDREGRGGGVAVLWRSLFKGQVISYAASFIDMEVTDDNLGVWRLTGFYGYSERAHKRDS